ncbi:MAG TPA: HAMP domain-containing sensor histidine kinase [Polyangiaceae bacterium]|nr:HAMP domain-containing sensor histidine kinase [Polyangiaceae bacterium]
MRFRHRHLLEFGSRPPRPMALKRQLFAWLVITILFTGLAVGLVFRIARVGDTHGLDPNKLSTFVAQSFAAVQEAPARRAELARALSGALHATVILEDNTGKREVFGSPCTAPDRSADILVNGKKTGSVSVCLNGLRDARLTGLIAACTVILVLWAAAAKLSRYLTRPLTALIAVTRDLGQGNLKRRVRLRRGNKGELGMLAESINDMAERIEAQLNEQRELLAAVSHEIRSPLARLRISTELLRGATQDNARLDAIDEEIAGIDALLGKILANSRLDFGTLTCTALSARAVALGALDRHGLPPENLVMAEPDLEVSADPTLLGRALDNLLENAQAHAQRPLGPEDHHPQSEGTEPKAAPALPSEVVEECAICLHVRPARPGEHPHPERAVAFELCDGGPGFDPNSLSRIFEPFRKQKQNASGASSARGSLGLGLSLVDRIAKAHGGRAWAKNLPQGGACVGLSIGAEVPLKAATSL